MTLMAENTTETTGLEPCSLKPLSGRVEGRDCGHINGLIKLLDTPHLQSVKAAHAELVIGCQCCSCWEHDKREMASLRRGR